MSEFKEKAQQLSPEIYRQFKQSLETGKWPDGRVLTGEQRALLFEAVIVYEHANVPEGQRIGEMQDQCASTAKNDASSDPGTSAVGGDEAQPIIIQ